MKGSTKNQLIALLVVAIVIVLVVWRLTRPREQHNTASNLVSVTYDPKRSPYLTYKFATPIDTTLIENTTAKLVSFVIAETQTPATGSAAFISSLIDSGNLPFVPIIPVPRPKTMSMVSSSTPAKELISKFPNAITVNATSGVMWLVIPPAAK